MLATVSKFFAKHQMARGMAIYAVIWPTSSTIQQLIANEKMDWKKNLRFFMFGSFFVAPTLYAWVKLTSSMWPKMSLKNGMTKAAVEQGSYGPMAGVCFFYFMSLMEGKDFKGCVQEVKDKFPQTYKVGVCFWPVVQTINFTFVSEKNRVPFVSVCSFCWTIFLAYMKQLEKKEENIIESPIVLSESLLDRLKSNLATKNS